MAPETEPLKYRKYLLPEEPPENTEPNRRLNDGNSNQPPPHLYRPPEASSQPNQSVKSQLQRTMAFAESGAPPAAEADAAPPPRAWSDRAPPPDEHHPEERIEIPGTHVPAWVVVVLVLGVIALLAILTLVLR